MNGIPQVLNRAIPDRRTVNVSVYAILCRFLSQLTGRIAAITVTAREAVAKVTQ